MKIKAGRDWVLSGLQKKLDRYKTATFHLSATTSVADLRKEFNEAFGTQVKVYMGNKVADTGAATKAATQPARRCFFRACPRILFATP